MEKIFKEHSKAIVLIIIIVVGAIFFYNSSKDGKHSKGPQALLIEKTGLAEFNAENDTISEVTAEDRKLGEEMMPIFKEMGDGKDATKNKETVVSLDKIISKYPQYSDAYVLRATVSLLANETDYSKVLADLDNAIKFHSSTKYKSAYDSTSGVYALRAKVDVLSGDYQKALDDIETALKQNLSDASSVFNTGGVKPEDDSNPSALQKKDFDLLVAKYPSDYRSYLFRGLFYNSFSFYDKQYYIPAVNDLKKATEINPNSALPYYFLGTLYHKIAFTTYAFKIENGTTADYDRQRDSANAKALEYFNKAIKLDQGSGEIYLEVANSFSSLKQYSDAISYFDKAIELEPENAIAYAERGEAKSYSNDSYGAISDFSKALEINKTKPNLPLGPDSTYEERATEYVKNMDYDNAIQDYSHAIGLKFASQMFLMSIPQIRALYPELGSINDADLLEGFRQKYFSDMTSKDFVDNYQHDSINKTEEKKPYKDFVIGDLYTSRGDAYVLKGDYKNASKDYNRAVYEGSTSIMDRWRPLSKTPSMTYSIDAQTIDFSQGNIVSLWIKTLTVASGNYDQSKYQIDCSGEKLKLVSSVSYDSYGNSSGTVGEQDWQIITPDTVGESWYKGACKN